MAYDEHELIVAAVSGDQVALQTLLVSVTEDLRRFTVIRLPGPLRDAVDPDDILQQTFVEVFRSIERYDPDAGASFRAWVQGICANVIRDSIKRHQRVKRGGRFRRVRFAAHDQSGSVATLIQLLADDANSPSQYAAGREAIDAVERAIELLPRDYRQAVELHFVKGFSVVEAAQKMDRSPRAVQGLLDRARKKLRETLDRLSKYA